jgi:methyl-accepting chemotaxis protein
MARTKLSTKLVLGGLIMLFVPILVLEIFSVQWASRAINNLEKDQLVVLKKVVADQVKIMLEAQTILLKNASTNDAVIQDTVKTIVQTKTVEIAQFNLDRSTTVYHDKNIYELFWMTDEKGNVIADTSQGKYRKTDISGEEYFKKALQGEMVIGKVKASEKEGQSYVIVAGPLKSADGGVIGVMVSGWKLDPLNRKIGELKLGKTGYAFVVDNSGLFIVHPNKEMMMKANISNLKGMETLPDE